MARATEVAGIYRRMVGARVRSEFQYRTSFALFLGSQFLVTFIDFLEIAVIFGQVDQLAGWSLGEVAFLYGTSAVSFSVCDMFVSQVEGVHLRIRTGTFDSLLIRPVSPLIQVVADDFALRRLGKVLQASAVLVGALVAVDIDWTLAKLGVFVLTLASGTVIFSAIFVAGACIQFFTIDAGEFMNAFTYGGNSIVQYPLTVYGQWMRRFFLFVVPVGFVNYFPALYLLGRPDADRFGLPALLRFGSPMVALAAAAVASVLWRSSVRHYRSTGS